MEVVVEKSKSGFYFLQFLSGAHDCDSIRVWVNQAFVLDKRDKYDRECQCVEFPVCGAQIAQTEKGTLVSGEIMAQGHRYHSDCGALGETAWVLINAQDQSRVTVRATRSGRHLTELESDMTFLLLSDGEKEEVMDSDLEALLQMSTKGES